MKAIILAGGSGSRLGEITKITPKPLVKVGKFPILVYIMKIYLKAGVNNFIIALGYKGEKIVKYFIKKKINKKKLKFGLTIKKKLFNKSCNITFLDTGKKSMTGGRLKRAAKALNEENFYVTYGDGLSNINLKKLTKFHFQQKKLVTITAVRPPARFGEIKIKKNKVSSFSEKRPIKTTWINGGFFVMNRNFLRLIKNDSSILERYPLEQAAKIGQLSAYKHTKFWQCMDTKRDRDKLNEILNKKIIKI